ncbi:hypothetical protein CL657_00020 [bacterium]|nr:hypothetical protein [bacterium]
MIRFKRSKTDLNLSKKSYLIIGTYAFLAITMAIISFFPFISEVSYRKGFFLAEQGKIQNHKYINRFKYSFHEYEKAIRFFPYESHYASEYIKSLDYYSDNTKNKTEKIFFLEKAISIMSYMQIIDTINPWYHARLSALYLKLFFHKKNPSLVQKSTFHARQALLSDYENPIFILNYANILQRNKRFSEAFYYYQKAIRIDDSIADAHFNLAHIYSSFSKFKYALNSYLKAKSLNKDFKYIDAVIVQTYMLLEEFEKAEQYIKVYELFYSKEDKTLEMISLFYQKQNKFFLSLSYLDLYFTLPQFESNPPDIVFYNRYIKLLNDTHQNHKIKPFITSHIKKYPQHEKLKSFL